MCACVRARVCIGKGLEKINVGLTRSSTLKNNIAIIIIIIIIAIIVKTVLYHSM